MIELDCVLFCFLNLLFYYFATHGNELQAE